MRKLEEGYFSGEIDNLDDSIMNSEDNESIAEDSINDYKYQINYVLKQKYGPKQAQKVQDILPQIYLNMNNVTDVYSKFKVTPTDFSFWINFKATGFTNIFKLLKMAMSVEMIIRTKPLNLLNVCHPSWPDVSYRNTGKTDVFHFGERILDALRSVLKITDTDYDFERYPTEYVYCYDQCIELAVAFGIQPQKAVSQAKKVFSYEKILNYIRNEASIYYYPEKGCEFTDVPDDVKAILTKNFQVDKRLIECKDFEWSIAGDTEKWHHARKYSIDMNHFISKGVNIPGNLTEHEMQIYDQLLGHIPSNWKIIDGWSKRIQLCGELGTFVDE